MTLDSAGRKRDSERKTRVHLSFFDRIKFLVLFGITYLVLVWALMSENPLYSFTDAASETADKYSLACQLDSPFSCGAERNIPDTHQTN